MSGYSWKETPIQTKITINFWEGCNMYLQILQLKWEEPVTTLVLQKRFSCSAWDMWGLAQWSGGTWMHWCERDSEGGQTSAARAVHCRRAATISTPMTVKTPYCKYEPPKNRKCSLYWAFEHLVADCMACSRFVMNEKIQTPVVRNHLKQPGARAHKFYFNFRFSACICNWQKRFSKYRQISPRNEKICKWNVEIQVVIGTTFKLKLP